MKESVKEEKVALRASVKKDSQEKCVRLIFIETPVLPEFVMDLLTVCPPLPQMEFTVQTALSENGQQKLVT